MFLYIFYHLRRRSQMSLPDKDGVESSCIDETDDAYKDSAK